MRPLYDQTELQDALIAARLKLLETELSERRLARELAEVNTQVSRLQKENTSLRKQIGISMKRKPNEMSRSVTRQQNRAAQKKKGG